LSLSDTLSRNRFFGDILRLKKALRHGLRRLARDPQTIISLGSQYVNLHYPLFRGANPGLIGDIVTWIEKGIVQKTLILFLFDGGRAG